MNLTDQLFEEGKQLGREKKYPEAVDAFKRLIEIAPDYDKARFELGKIYMYENKSGPAIEEFLKAVSLNPTNVYARLLLAKLYKGSGRYAESVDEFKKAMECGYPDENIPKEIADVYALSGDFVSAREFLEKARQQGYGEEQCVNEVRSLCQAQIRVIQEHNLDGRYTEALESAGQAGQMLPPGDLMLRNAVLSEVEIAQKKIILDSTPRSLTFTLTNKCNLRCIMCKTRTIEWDLPEKAKKEIVSLLPSLERVMWQGGEAFLYDGFEELLDEAARYPIRQVIATNGLLITDRIAEKLVKYNVELTFSIDGITKEVYEHIRPGAKFEDTLAKVELVNALRARYNPAMRTRLQFSTVFFNASGCDFENVQENIFYYDFDAENVAYMNTIRKEIQSKADAYGIRLENWLPSEQFFSEIQKSAPDQPPAGAPNPATSFVREPELFCHAPWQRLYIDNSGFVRPDCLCPVSRAIGNVKENSIMELWNGEKLQEYRKTIVQGACKGFCNNDCVFGRVPKKNLKFI
jgi:MoaA/NifB/PqqE/SkfB family radical SAM enzyme